MTDKIPNITAKALHGVHFALDGVQVVKTPHDKPFKMPETTFNELRDLGAVRKATKADTGDVDDEEVAPPQDPGLNLLARTYSVEEAAAFAPKHKGAGKFVVVLGDVVVSENDDGKGFDGKEAAEAWITEQRKLAGDPAEENLLT